MTAFILDERLANDTVLVGDLALSRVLLMNDARFPWAVLVPRRAGLTEFHDLFADDRRLLADEIAEVSAALQKITGAAKMNVGALGNIVRQFHVHIVARAVTDAAWPGPVWGMRAALPYAPENAQALARRLATALCAPDR